MNSQKSNVVYPGNPIFVPITMLEMINLIVILKIVQVSQVMSIILILKDC